MSSLSPFLSIFLSFALGVILTKKLSIETSKFRQIFFAAFLGVIIFTALNYFNCLIFSFPNGLLLAHLESIIIIIFSIPVLKPKIKIPENLIYLQQDLLLIILLLAIGIILISLFHTHVVPSINGDLYTGESTYGDLPFHLSTISEIAYAHNFPPQNPMFAGLPLVYPYFINFYSAILVLGGLTLRDSIVIPGFFLSLSLIALIYDFAFALTKSNLKSFIATLLYLFNGGLGFYFFLKDHSFYIPSIITSLQNPTQLKEYSHLFDQNIQWPNFLSRMIVPERSLLFGIPAGLIILRLLYFRNSETKPTMFDLIIVSILLSILPLLHTHTALVMAIILPILSVSFLRKNTWRQQISAYAFILVLTLILLLPQYSLFLNHLSGSNNFFKSHLWWMKTNTEPLYIFWFKNSYLLILLSLPVFFSKIGSFSLRILEICGLILLLLVNLFLFQPYDWDNVKLLFWAGIFFSISMSSFLVFLISKRNLLLNLAIFLIILTSVSTALLSIYREINVKYILFSKEAVSVGEQIRKTTPHNSIFLTYKIHNSPINNLAGRPILMGYPGLLWVHGINYHDRERDINNIYAGSDDAKILIRKHGIDYVAVESSKPEDMQVNAAFFDQYPVLLKTENYIIYKVR